MREREKRGDVPGPSRGDYSADDFSDWNNPEDADDPEEAPEGYYDEDEDEDDLDDEDDGYIPGPDDPDYDLSEAAGYAGWDEPRRRGPIPQWVIVVISIVLILVFVLPMLFRP